MDVKLYFICQVLYVQPVSNSEILPSKQNRFSQWRRPIRLSDKRSSQKIWFVFILSACFMCCLWRGILNVYAFIALLKVFKVFFYNTLNFYNKVWNCFTQINYCTCDFNGYSVLLLLILWKLGSFTDPAYSKVNMSERSKHHPFT